MPMKRTYKFDRNSFPNDRSIWSGPRFKDIVLGYPTICNYYLSQLFEIPPEIDTIYITISSAPMRDSYLIKQESRRNLIKFLDVKSEHEYIVLSSLSLDDFLLHEGLVGVEFYVSVQYDWRG